MDYGKTTRVQDITVASAYQAWLPCQQAAPDATVDDLSGNGADAALGANHTSADIWTNAGWATTVTGANDDTFKIPVAKISWDMFSGESFLLSFWTKDIDATTTDGILGTAGANGETGFRMMINSANGKVRNLDVFDDQGVIGNANSYGDDISSGIFHHVFAVDGVAKTGMYWQNAVNLESGYLYTPDAAATTTQPGLDLFFGSDAETNDTVGGQFRDIHFLVWSGGMPSNIGNIVNLLYTRPFYPLSSTEFSL